MICRGRESDTFAEIPLAKLKRYFTLNNVIFLLSYLDSHIRVDPLLWAYGILLSVLSESDGLTGTWEDVKVTLKTIFLLLLFLHFLPFIYSHWHIRKELKSNSVFFIPSPLHFFLRCSLKRFSINGILRYISPFWEYFLFFLNIV